MTFHTQSKNRNRIKRDSGRHILNGLNFNITRSETSKATHPIPYLKNAFKKSANDSLRDIFHSMDVATHRERFGITFWKEKNSSKSLNFNKK